MSSGKKKVVTKISVS